MPPNNELKILISAEVDKYISALNKAENSTVKFGSKTKSAFSEIGSGIGLNPASMGIAGITAALIAAGTAAVKASSDFEQYKVSFEVMTGSAEKGLSLLNSLRDFANVTPFTTDDLAQASKVLLQFGVDINEVMPTLKVLGDVSGGNSEKLNSLVLAFGQMSSAGRLMGQDLLQMINAGFNPLQEISKRTGKSMSELKDAMEKGAISSGMVKQAFIDATAEGGRFHDMMQKQSETTAGTFSTMIDTWGKVAVAVGDTLAPAIKTAISWVTKLGEETYKAGEFWQMFFGKTSGMSKDALLSEKERLEATIKRQEDFAKKYKGIQEKTFADSRNKESLLPGLSNDPASLLLKNKNNFKVKVAGVLDPLESKTYLSDIKKLKEINKELDKINKNKLDTDVSNINVNTGSTKPVKPKKTGSKPSSIKIDKETIGYGDYSKELEQKLSEESKQIDKEKNLIFESYHVKAELRKQGLKDTDRDFKDELALKIDHFRRQSEIEKQITKESEDAKNAIKKKKRDDIINISGGNAANKSEAIAAINAEADKQLKAIDTLTAAKKKSLIANNQLLTDAKKAEMIEQKRLDLEEARLQIADQKAASTNEYDIGKEQLSVNAKLLTAPSIEKEKEILLDFDNFKLDLELAEIERLKQKANGDPIILEKLEQDKSDIIKRHTLAREQIEAEAEQRTNARMLNFRDDLTNGWSNEVGQLINGTLAFQDAVTSTTDVIRNAFANMATDMAEKWLKEHLTMEAISEAFHAKELFMDSKSVVVKAIKSVIETPFVGPALAVGAAAGAVALISKYTKRENGGPVNAGQTYLVGEREPELFVPRTSGTILNGKQMKGLANGISGEQPAGQNIVIAFNPVFKNLDPAEGQKMFDKWMDTSGLPKVAKAIKNNSHGMRQTIQAV